MGLQRLRLARRSTSIAELLPGPTGYPACVAAIPFRGGNQIPQPLKGQLVDRRGRVRPQCCRSIVLSSVRSALFRCGRPASIMDEGDDPVGDKGIVLHRSSLRIAVGKPVNQTRIQQYPDESGRHASVTVNAG